MLVVSLLNEELEIHMFYWCIVLTSFVHAFEEGVLFIGYSYSYFSILFLFTFKDKATDFHVIKLLLLLIQALQGERLGLPMSSLTTQN